MEFPRRKNIKEVLDLPYASDIEGSLESEYHIVFVNIKEFP